jgi:hypothetical protein
LSSGESVGIGSGDTGALETLVPGAVAVALIRLASSRAADRRRLG